jgi:ribosome-associated protein
MATPLEIRPGLVLPPDELEVSFARSGGPGGQNVNKVESKVVLRFAIPGSRVLSAAERERLLVALRPRLTNAGEIVIHADRFRDRSRNLEDARNRLVHELLSGLFVPKTRRKTRPTRGSTKRRIETKRRRSDIKRTRRGSDE